MRARSLIAFGAAVLALALPATASAKTVFDGVQAHRGGPNPGGQGVYPEDAIPAFEAADKLDVDVIELDVKLTSDNVPVVIHDATLDRTTNCAGQVRARVVLFLQENCRIDTVGGEALLRPAPPGVTLPTLKDTLEWAFEERAKVNIEIKNYPTDPDYTPGPGFANTVLQTIEGGALPKSHVLIQSFLPQNLDPAKARGFKTSLLLLQQGSNQAGIDLAARNDYDFVSPGWPTAGEPEDFVDRAHRAGLAVVPYTVDSLTDIRLAINAGVDALITNDVPLAMRTYYAPKCRTAKARERRLLKTYKKRLKAHRKARGTPRARRLGKRAASARKAHARAKRARRLTCAKIPG
jgi:glycerophosphoryl diester phosphodiesterase